MCVCCVGCVVCVCVLCLRVCVCAMALDRVYRIGTPGDSQKRLSSSRDEDELSRELEAAASEGSFSLDAVDESSNSFDNGVPVEILVPGQPKYDTHTHTNHRTRTRIRHRTRMAHVRTKRLSRRTCREEEVRVGKLPKREWKETSNLPPINLLSMLTTEWYREMVRRPTSAS